MSRLILVTAANAPYLPRIAPYLHSIQEHGAAFDWRVFVTVGCRVEMPPELSSIEAIPLPAARAVGHTGNFCIQQGCFLDAIDLDDDDVIVFTDGDIVLQRAPLADELAWMRAIPHGCVSAAWNAGPDDILAYEADRIGLTMAGRAPFLGVLHQKVYNVGVFVARAATYRQIYTSYMAAWPTFAREASHYAANQFLMCAVVHQLGLRVWEMDLQTHTHGCFGLPSWAREGEDGALTVDALPVLFRHHW